MAKNSKVSLRNMAVYQVFVRQHSETGDFLGVVKDLDRIKDMGFDVVYLLPFHPIGKKDRKGDVGSPYAIFDYYEIDTAHGTLDDLITLRKEVNKRGMKLMMDIVFNHTSRDSKLTVDHPEWFYKNSNGGFANRVGDWSDITDLNYDIKAVWEYMANVLAYWAKYVDGFRCDVAPLITIDFWEYAKEIVSKVNKDMIWLTESVEPSFIKYIRDIGYDASSDSTMYDVFDVCYDYDIFKYMDDFLKDESKLSRWLEEIMRQETIYPKNYVKLRSFENHDQDRIASKVKDLKQLMHLTAMQMFIKGMPMIYAGQEHLIKKRPDLFEKDLIKWNKDNSIEEILLTLNKLKKDPIMSTGVFELKDKENAIFTFSNDEKVRYGIFDLRDRKRLSVPLKDGRYDNLYNGKEVIVKQGYIEDLKDPVIIDIKNSF